MLCYWQKQSVSIWSGNNKKSVCWKKMVDLDGLLLSRFLQASAKVVSWLPFSTSIDHFILHGSQGDQFRSFMTKPDLYTTTSAADAVNRDAMTPPRSPSPRGRNPQMLTKSDRISLPRSPRTLTQSPSPRDLSPIPSHAQL